MTLSEANLWARIVPFPHALSSTRLKCEARRTHAHAHIQSWLTDTFQSPAPLEVLLSSRGLSISYSRDAFAFAFSPTSMVGIDLEQQENQAFERRSARHIFHPFEKKRYDELVAVDRLGSDRFCSWIWVRKEAVLKCWGTGFSLCPRTFHVLNGEVEWPFAPGAQSNADQVQALNILDLDLGPPFHGAIAWAKRGV